MVRPSVVVFSMVFAGACGTTDDDRPPTLEYVTQTILAPACGNAECHSSFKAEGGWTFDSVAAVQKSVRKGLLVIRNVEDPEDFDSTLMMHVLLRNVDRMPYDQPLPQGDIDLIREWVSRDATTFDDARVLSAPGAKLVLE